MAGETEKPLWAQVKELESQRATTLAMYRVEQEKVQKLREENQKLMQTGYESRDDAAYWHRQYDRTKQLADELQKELDTLRKKP